MYLNFYNSSKTLLSSISMRFDLWWPFEFVYIHFPTHLKITTKSDCSTMLQKRQEVPESRLEQFHIANCRLHIFLSLKLQFHIPDYCRLQVTWVQNCRFQIPYCKMQITVQYFRFMIANYRLHNKKLCLYIIYLQNTSNT